MKVLVLGGDGFCGWPTALHLSNRDYDVVIVDNLSRRAIDDELGVQSLTPIASIGERLTAWHEVTGKEIRFLNVDIAQDYAGLMAMLEAERPDAIVHFAEQRSAPYSMTNSDHKRYTVDNNTNATHNLLAAVVDSGQDIHVVHLGTMGVYGYGTAGMAIPEGYLDIQIPRDDGEPPVEQQILYPTNPGSIYHMTKTLDQLLFAYYAKNDRLRITDLHQGIVWGTNTAECKKDERLVNRFDYDGDYGTVLNRFLMQAAVKYPMTVHGTGGQTRAFIHIEDTANCVRMAIENPPAAGERVKILNQLAETLRVRDLAYKIADMTGAEVAMVPDPRKEDLENELHVRHDTFLSYGWKPITLDDGLLMEVTEVAERYAERCDTSKIPARSLWTRDHKPGVPEGWEDDEGGAPPVAQDAAPVAQDAPAAS